MTHTFSVSNLLEKNKVEETRKAEFLAVEETFKAVFQPFPSLREGNVQSCLPTFSKLKGGKHLKLSSNLFQA